MGMKSCPNQLGVHKLRQQIARRNGVSVLLALGQRFNCWVATERMIAISRASYLQMDELGLASFSPLFFSLIDIVMFFGI
jgi:hypothetical protein